MAHTVFFTHAISRLTLVTLAIMLGAPAHGEPPTKSSRVAPVKYGNGSGIVLMDVDYATGKVTSARMLDSTGYPRCDAAALAAFRNWRFKPHTRSPLKTPITFSPPRNCR